MSITRVIHALGDVVALGSAALARQMPGGGFVVVPAQGGGEIPAALVLMESGALAHKAAPSASDRRLFLTADGHHVAATSQPTGSRPLSLSGGAWQAGSAS